MVDKEVIKQRKRVYGNNFECIAKMWETFLRGRIGVTSAFRGLSGADVAKMMAMMKTCRENAILKAIEENGKNEEFENALIDTRIDYENYKWIGENYEEYERL